MERGFSLFKIFIWASLAAAFCLFAVAEFTMMLDEHDEHPALFSMVKSLEQGSQ